jgi:hypothetical protein
MSWNDLATLVTAFAAPFAALAKFVTALRRRR